mmetsp:Transcript_28794/g.67996  ORF Transcript_28794/g.67996 Transcript_28794/m.67996 type:complete len:512 (+) Transcript_28794:105-1640(+)|eukprot:CAMPEP_0117024942 /NCGR_PEP_ID=MMETSP0472-20121206/18477_1 /TAXON_ID=693140 ORGANISM="Tiarina fusus, Strain LIS" /NCGR_SAMPLE_ID=MMETSP0472 /ASSEMBLY_ACC=CAM_ASM_000603 /LENGTH=511 /DNA_ID=CAMNT_0004731525 /DNA_START=124 /DNA_END=1659 /DNA_ORIENTATION=+
MDAQADLILGRLKPQRAADNHRARVLQFVTSVIRKCVPDAQVCPFGSVPLKTYLPHGDLDLTVFTLRNDSWLEELAEALRQEEKNQQCNFVTRDVHCVTHDRVEVKVVKCVVDDVPVDISVNQHGGLRSLCFLEQFDRKVGRNHLYKEGLLLVKGWCYFEARVLGSQHGLIATYALETLVVCILNLFYTELSTPVHVLFKFLEYFSTFDWENCYVTIFGPAPKSPTSKIEPPKSTTPPLISEEFLKPYQDPRHYQDLPLKFMNVRDPLSPQNNLGRSVSEGNFYRIKRALAKGRDTLEQVLNASLPIPVPGKDLMMFYSCTLRSLGHDSPSIRPDIGDYACSRPASFSLAQASERAFETDSDFSHTESQSHADRVSQLSTLDGFEGAELPWVTPVDLVVRIDQGDDGLWEPEMVEVSDDDSEDEEDEEKARPVLSKASVHEAAIRIDEALAEDILAANLDLIHRQLEACDKYRRTRSNMSTGSTMKSNKPPLGSKQRNGSSRPTSRNAKRC